MESVIDLGSEDDAPPTQTRGKRGRTTTDSVGVIADEAIVACVDSTRPQAAAASRRPRRATAMVADARLQAAGDKEDEGDSDWHAPEEGSEEALHA